MILLQEKSNLTKGRSPNSVGKKEKSDASPKIQSGLSQGWATRGQIWPVRSSAWKAEGFHDFGQVTLPFPTQHAWQIVQGASPPTPSSAQLLLGAWQ